MFRKVLATLCFASPPCVQTLVFSGVQYGNVDQKWINPFHVNVPFLYPLTFSGGIEIGIGVKRVNLDFEHVFTLLMKYHHHPVLSLDVKEEPHAHDSIEKGSRVFSQSPFKQFCAN